MCTKCTLHEPISRFEAISLFCHIYIDGMSNTRIGGEQLTFLITIHSIPLLFLFLFCFGIFHVLQKKQMECFIFLSVVVGPTFNIIHGSHFVTPFPKTKAFISYIFLLSDVFNVLFCYSLVTFVVVAQKVAQNSHQLIKPSHVYKHFFDKSNLIRMGFPTTALSTH